jgi:uncharacterized protein
MTVSSSRPDAFASHAPAAPSTFRRELNVLTEAAPPRVDVAVSPDRPRRLIPMEEFFQRIGYVTLKVTRGCNLSCSYCNVEAETPRTPRMALSTYMRVADLLVGSSGQHHVGLEFHGGEPLLLPDEWFEEAVAYGSALGRRHGKAVEFPLVTNGTLLTEERLLRMRALGIRFCLSVDGPPEINDQVRGGGKAVERAIGLFRRHGVRFGVLLVMSRANYQHMDQIMDWFREVGITNYRVNFLEAQGRGNDETQLLRGEEMFEGMRQVLDHLDRTGLSVSEGLMMKAVRRFVRGREPAQALSCWNFQCQAGRIYCAVDHTGTIHACGTDVVHHPLGHIDAAMDLDHYDAVLRRLHHKDDWTIRCFDCDAKRICAHGCPTADFNSKQQREYECRYTKLLYQHLCDNVEKAARVLGYDLARRGLPPGATFVPLTEIRLR